MTKVVPMSFYTSDRSSTSKKRPKVTRVVSPLNSRISTKEEGKCVIWVEDD